MPRPAPSPAAPDSLRGLLATLGLGIGASTTIFAVLNAVVLRPIPYPDPDRLLRVWEVSPQGVAYAFSQPDFLDLRDRVRGVMDVGAIEAAPVTLLGPSGPTSLRAGLTTAAAFHVFGATPALGRLFGAGEELPGRIGPVAILGHAVWQEHFGADVDIVGRTLRFGRGPVTVVGVMPRGFDFPVAADLWLPRPARASAAREDRRLSVFARLAEGVALERAREAVREFAAELGERHPATNRSWSADVIPLADWIVGPDVRLISFTLLSAVGLLLLIITANASNLLMARTAARQREIDIRAAIGAGRLRVVRQLFAECLLLAAGGALLGLLLSLVLVPLAALQPEVVPRLGEVDMDRRVWSFALGVSLSVGVAIGLAPAFQASRWRVHEALTESGEVGLRGVLHMRDLLVVGEVALAMILLVGAGLLSRSFIALHRADPGFDTEHLFAVEVALGARRPPQAVVSAYEVALGELRELEGVAAAAGTSMRYFDLSPRFFTELGRIDSAIEEFVIADWRVVTDGYFEAAGVELVSGREPAAEAEAVISRRLATALWDGEEAVGRTLLWEGPEGPVSTVVGVVADVADVHPALPQVASAYIALGAQPLRSLTLLVRTGAAADASLPRAVRELLQRVDPEASVSEVRPVSARFAEVVALDRFLVTFLTLVAAVAVTLAALGLYGLVSFSVARRSHEIGVRMALGGRPAAIVAMLFRHGLRLVATGIVVGGAVAVAVARVVSSVLFRTEPTDPLTYVTVGVLLTVVSLGATYVPARRATRADPRATLVA